MPGGEHCTSSAIGLALTAVVSEPVVHDRLRCDPKVRILVIKAERSTAKCRLREQFPMTVMDRGASPLVKSLETPWTICDLEDVVAQASGRRVFAELETCKLRCARGIYGQKGDDLHFRGDIAVAAGDELIKACRRTALGWYGDTLGHGSVLLILAAGWNSNHTNLTGLSQTGSAWRKADIVALAELCALNGHPFSAVQARMTELLARADERHSYFLKREVAGILAIPAPPPREHAPEQREHATSQCSGHLEGWMRKRRLSDLDVERPGGEGCAAAAKRRREADILADMMRLPVETADSILMCAGSLDAALNLPMFQEAPRSAPEKNRSSARSLGVIDLEHPDVHEEALQFVATDEELRHFREMGFTTMQATSALKRARGDFARAVELLV